MTSDDIKLDTCGCCEGIKPRPPRYNTPGKPALNYRLDTHTHFLRRMMALLHIQSIPDGVNAGSRPLSALTTRSGDDPSIAVLDAWSVVADVLTFYQERIANECFLRTASERRSVLELARAIGYELKAGVAASTYLAFTLEDVPGAPGHAVIDVGTKVLSIPGQDERPQTFETIEKIEAMAEWNALRPGMTVEQTLDFGAKEVYLKGVDTRLKPGDWLLFVGEERELDSDSERWDLRKINTVSVDQEAGHTRVNWDEGLGWEESGYMILPAQKKLKVYAFRQHASLFGYNAPDWRAMSDNIKQAFFDRIGSGSGLYAEYFTDINLTNLKVTQIDTKVDFNWGYDSPDPLIESDDFSVRWTGFVQSEISGYYKFYTDSNDGVRLWVDGKKIIDNWTLHSTTRNRGSKWLEKGKTHDIKLEFFNQTGEATIKLYWEGPGQSFKIIQKSHLYPPDYYLKADQWPDFNFTPPDVYLDAVYPGILKDSWLVLSTPEYQELYQIETVAEDSRSDFSLTSKTTRLTLKGENLDEFKNKLRETAVFARSEFLDMAEAPLTDPIEDNSNSIMLNKKVDNLTSGQLLIVSGRESNSDEMHSEVVTLLGTELDENITKIVFDPPLSHSYKRDTVTINANVVRATHGETVHEVLGSGSAVEPNQCFILKKPPLTYISAPTPSGAVSTLEVRVNRVQWQESFSLYGLNTNNQGYIVRIDDDGKTNITFGDGKNGALLPTGVENVTAIYRSGIGLEGEVGVGSLTLLQTRPLGVHSVTNPLPASGAESQEKLSDARHNAPVTVLTMDRIVSLRDFENFTRSFAGIGKAQASALMPGQNPVVHITIAAANGSNVDRELKEYLCNAIDAVRDPIEPVQVDNFLLRTFSIKADVLIDPQYLTQDVLEQVEASLINAFSFENRNFGQPVTAAEVLLIMQTVEGVVAVDLDKLELDPVSTSGMYKRKKVLLIHRSSAANRRLRSVLPGSLIFKRPFPHTRLPVSHISPDAVLPSKKARVQDGDIHPAELLLLNPDKGSVDLKEIIT